MKKEYTRLEPLPARRPARESFRSSLGEAGFLSLCISLGVLVFFAGILFALFAASPTAWVSHGEAKPPEFIHPASGTIDRADGTNCQYTITHGTNTIALGTTDTGNHCVWCETVIPLPFPFVLYDQTFTTVNVTSSGRLDFVCINEPAGYTETCLPAPPNNCPYDTTLSSRCGLSGPPMQSRPVAQHGQMGVAFSPRFQALHQTEFSTSNGAWCTVKTWRRRGISRCDCMRTIQLGALM